MLNLNKIGSIQGRRLLLLGVAFSISLLSVIIAASLSEVTELKGAIWPEEPVFLLWTAMALTISYGLRAWRLAMIMNIPLSPGLTQIAFLHNLFNALLPAKLGELALPILIKRYQNFGLAKGLGILVIIRFLDVLGLLFLCSIVMMAQGNPWDDSSRILGLIGLILIFSLLLSMIIVSRYFRRQQPTVDCSAHWQKVRNIWLDFGHSLAGLSGYRFGYAALLSILIWLSIAVAFHVTALAFGLTATVVVTTLATTSATLAFMLPINGLASLGPPQLAWAGITSMLGGEWERGLVAATVTQLIALTVMGLLVVSLSAFIALDCKKAGVNKWSSI